MSLKEELRLPMVSESQRIGRLANKAFVANDPNSWLHDSVDGDNDFGYDYQIQVESEGLIKDSFRLQLKGTTVPALNASGTEFSISLDVATVNYYARATEPVLLVICDLSVDIDHPKNCPLYYQWIQNDIQRIRRRGISERQESVTFHISVENRLLESTDLTSDLERFCNLAKSRH
jgi:hypothetical protein